MLLRVPHAIISVLAVLRRTPVQHATPHPNGPTTPPPTTASASLGTTKVMVRLLLFAHNAILRAYRAQMQLHVHLATLPVGEY